MAAPVTEKISDDGENEYITFGSSSMQGYRFTQEDAYNCCTDFGKNSSLFAVYDGHGGAEVALYCAKKLPDFLKSTEAYQKGDFEQALKDTFIGLDSTLVDDAVVDELKKLANEALDRLCADTDKDTEKVMNVFDRLCPEAADPGAPQKQLQDLLKSMEAYEKGDIQQALNCAVSNGLDSTVVDAAAVDDLKKLVNAFADADEDTVEATIKDTVKNAVKDTVKKAVKDTVEYDDFQYTVDSEQEEDESDIDDYDDGVLDNMAIGPGQASGCTAVVALLVGRELFVANAGDSRCVLCRNGKAVGMSIDQKPEDKEESLRILKAGGRVTKNGRVNDGLNVSRAIGDHTYKTNKDLRPEEQMITAMPVVKTVTLQDDDEFIVLACDGIWNCMSSEEVVAFVRARLTDKKEKISSIMEELFNKCLEPDADGDVFGCDNMTAILIQLKKNFK